MTTCSRQRCKRRASEEGLCKTHLKQRKDRAFSLRIRARDGRCLACGTTVNLQCAHIVSAVYPATRWNEDNAITLCRADHKKFTEWPLIWEAWLGENFPGRLERMKDLARGMEGASTRRDRGTGMSLVDGHQMACSNIPTSMG